MILTLMVATAPPAGPARGPPPLGGPSAAEAAAASETILPPWASASLDDIEITDAILFETMRDCSLLVGSRYVDLLPLGAARMALATACWRYDSIVQEMMALMVERQAAWQNIQRLQETIARRAPSEETLLITSPALRHMLNTPPTVPRNTSFGSAVFVPGFTGGTPAVAFNEALAAGGAMEVDAPVASTSGAHEDSDEGTGEEEDDADSEEEGDGEVADGEEDNAA